MAVIRIKDAVGNADFAGTRVSGEIIRKQIEKHLDTKSSGVTLDFSLVDMITQSFGDEIIGILVRGRGAKFVGENIRLVNANQDIKDTLNFIIRYSSQQALSA